MSKKRQAGETPHRWVERRWVPFAIWAFIAIFIGSAIEIIPTLMIKNNYQTIKTVKPYTPLELQGRDIYIREGCYLCHSQQVRPFRSEVERYGEYSKAGEFIYDHPYLWGSRRTGPDLARTGVKGGKMYKDAVWHYKHMNNPADIEPNSIMPRYPWIVNDDLDNSLLENKINAMRTLGVPYPEGFEKEALANLKAQAQGIAKELKAANIETTADKEIIALIAYLHRLGKDISESHTAEK